MGSILSLLSLGFGCFGFVPTVLAVVALIDSFRVRADWYWCMIILGLPVVGPIAYFVVVRSSLLGARNTWMVSPASARRLQAWRRMREFQVQLSHWRGPAVLAEAGEEQVVLGKPQEAEKLLRESRENGGAVEDVNFPLAQALEMQGRWAEAVPLLEELVKAEPDARLGQGPLNLGRCLDEAGRKDEAEGALRKVLERRTVIEAQVRLARILLLQGRKEEGGKLLAEVLADAKILPRYLKREHGAWIRTAARLKSGSERLPKPRFEGSQPPGYRLRIALGAAAALVALVVLVLLGAYAWTQVMGMGASFAEVAGDLEATRGKLDALNQQYPWKGGDLATLDLQPADLERYLAVRRNLQPALLEVAELKRHESVQSAGDGNVFQAADFAQRWVRADVTFLERFHRELDRQHMGPREIDDLTALIEWRFLRRPEALVFGLPDYHRSDLIQTRTMLAANDDMPQDPTQPGSRQWEQWRKRSQAKAADYERQATAATVLSPATRTLLESRRADLERLNPEDAPYLLHALDESVPLPGY